MYRLVAVAGALAAVAGILAYAHHARAVHGPGPYATPPNAVDVSSSAELVAALARNFVADGIVVDTYPKKMRPKVLPILGVLDIANVSRRVPRSSHGTAEACLWLGTPVLLDGAKLRSCAWDGMWTGFNAAGSRY